MNSFAHWHAGEATGTHRIEAELSTSAAPDAAKMPRKAQRVEVELGAALRQRGATGVSVQIMDLSVSGFRAATHLELPAGTDVWLRLPRLEPCHARVIWSHGNYLGCEFMRPLHPAVLQMIVSNAGRR